MKNTKINHSKTGDMILIIFISLIGIVMVIPFLFTLSASVKPLNELWIFPPRLIVSNPTIKNFTDLFGLMNDSWIPFSRYIYNTLIYSVVGTFGNVMVSSMCAYSISKLKFRGSQIIFQVIVFALMFNSTVTAVPNFLIIKNLGLLDTIWAIILPSIAAPMGLYLMKQFMETLINDSLLEAARIDGVNEWGIFTKIVMPLVKPAWLTLIVFSFQGLWNMGANNLIRSEELKTINYAISQITAGGIARAGTSAAASLLMMLVPIMVFVVTQSNIIETMATSGMKD